MGRSRRWNLANETDWTAQGTITGVGSDGDTVVNGVTYTKVNSANDQTAMVVTSGTGLVMIPKASSFDYSNTGSTKSLPYLKFSVASIIPNFHQGMWLRFWIYVSASNHAANFDQVVCSLESGTSWASVIRRGYCSGVTPVPGIGKHAIVGAAGSFVSSGVSDTENVLVTEVGPLSDGYFRSRTYSGTYSSGFPKFSALTSHATAVNNTSVVPIVTNASIVGLMGAMRFTSATAYSATIARTRLEYWDPGA